MGKVNKIGRPPYEGRRVKMVCDIHVHAEIKIDGKWEYYNQIDIGRDYTLFARMANVRNSCRTVEPISNPRGLPEDASVTTKLESDSWCSDGHSHSWISLDEIILLEKEGYNFDYFFGNDFSDFRDYPRDDISCIQDVRIVFWFDN